jgi:hypothetical protein
MRLNIAYNRTILNTVNPEFLLVYIVLTGGVANCGTLRESPVAPLSRRMECEGGRFRVAYQTGPEIR